MQVAQLISREKVLACAVAAISGGLLAAPAAGQIVLNQEGFESATVGDLNAGSWVGRDLPSGPTQVQNTVVHTGNQAYEIGRNQNLTGSENGYLASTTGFRQSADANVFSFSAWYYIGSTNPAGGGQNSSHAELWIRDANNVYGPRFGLWSDRNNNLRRITWFTDPAGTETRTVTTSSPAPIEGENNMTVFGHFQTNAWYKLTISMDETAGTWGRAVADAGESVLASMAGIDSYFNAGFQKQVGNYVAYSQNHRSNDGIYHRIDDLEVTAANPVTPGDPTWAPDRNGTWADGGNWYHGVPGAGSQATLGGAIAGPWTVTLSAAGSVGTLRIDSAEQYTIAGTGALTVNGGLQVVSGSHAVTAPIVFGGGAALSVAEGSSLALSGSVGGAISHLDLGAGATLDLTTRHLVIDYAGGASPAAELRAALAAAHNDGRWDGAGITSSAAREDVLLATGLGYADTAERAVAGLDATSVLVKYTWYGDANLDGIVDDADRVAISAGGATWATGDFNYDGVVNGDDWALFNLGQASQTGVIGDAVPEPGVAGLAAVSLAAICGRRSRGRGARGA